MLFIIQDPQFGATVVHAKDIEEADAVYKSYLSQINATSTGATASINTAAAGNAPVGAHLVTAFNGVGTFIGTITGGAGSRLSFEKVNNLAGLDSDAFYSNLYTAGQTPETAADATTTSTFGNYDPGAGNIFEAPLSMVNPQETIAPDVLGMQRAQYMGGLRDRGIGMSGIAGKQRREAFEPTFNRFLFESMMNPEAGKFSAFDADTGTLDLTGADAPSFSEYTRTSPLFGREAINQAKGQFAQALAASKGVNPVGVGFDTLTPGQQDILNPQSAAQAGILNSLANQTARARYGVGAEFLGNRDYTNEFFGQAKTPGALSFAEFLNNRIFGSGPNPLTAMTNPAFAGQLGT